MRITPSTSVTASIRPLAYSVATTINGPTNTRTSPNRFPRLRIKPFNPRFSMSKHAKYPARTKNAGSRKVWKVKYTPEIR